LETIQGPEGELRIFIAASARKEHDGYRCSNAQIRYVLEHSGVYSRRAARTNPSARQHWFFGVDDQGTELEIMGIPTRDEDGEAFLLVIHAMPLREMYRTDFASAMRWWKR
jgi:hypothetical protein